MRVMVIAKGDKNSEAGILPKKELFAEMGKFNEQLAKAGVMLAADAARIPATALCLSFGISSATLIHV
jgi:hypothetical protein